MPLPALAYPIIAGLASYGPRLAPYANRAASAIGRIMPRSGLVAKDIPWKQAIIGAGIEEGLTKGLSRFTDIPEDYLDIANNAINITTGQYPRKAVAGLTIDALQLPVGKAEASISSNQWQASPDPSIERKRMLDQAMRDYIASQTLYNESK